MARSAHLNSNFYLYDLNKHFPQWASLDHPIVKREMLVWQTLSPKMEGIWNNIWFLFLFAPLILSALGGLGVLIGAFYNQGFALPLLAFLWLIQFLPSWGIKMTMAIGASLVITRERETLNWTLLQIMPMPLGDIIRAKIAGLLHGMTEPILVLLMMRTIAAVATSILLSKLAQQSSITTSAFAFTWQPSAWISGALLALLIFSFSFIELATSLLYNSSMGLLASTLSRNSTNAIAVTFTFHLIFWLLIFLPIQQIISPAIQTLIAKMYYPQAAEIIAPIISNLFIPVIIESWLAFTAFRVAIKRAQNLTD